MVTTCHTCEKQLNGIVAIKCPLCNNLYCGTCYFNYYRNSQNSYPIKLSKEILAFIPNHFDHTPCNSCITSLETQLIEKYKNDLPLLINHHFYGNNTQQLCKQTLSTTTTT